MKINIVVFVSRRLHRFHGSLPCLSSTRIGFAEANGFRGGWGYGVFAKIMQFLTIVHGNFVFLQHRKLLWFQALISSEPPKWLEMFKEADGGNPQKSVLLFP